MSLISKAWAFRPGSRRGAPALLIACVAAACGGTSTGPSGTARIVISPRADTVFVGSTRQFGVTVTDSHGQPQSNPTVNWSSRDTTVATVSPSGLASGLAVGTTHIVASSDGSTDSASITVRPIPVASISISPATDTLAEGDSVQLTAMLEDSLGRPLSGRPVAWMSSDTLSATVSTTGLVRVVAGGAVTVTASSGGRSGSAQVFSLVRLMAVSAGYDHTCAIGVDSLAYCWGANDQGQVGHGDHQNTVVPVRVASAIHFVSISAGGDGVSSHSCALTASGNLWCWGQNGNGELGDGTVNSRTTPGLVPGGQMWADVAVGFGVTCGVTTSGKGYCWGFNGYGQLGIGSTTDAHQPTAVAGGLQLASITVGFKSTCGLGTSGQAYCWGFGFYGALGDSSTADTSQPAAVVGGLNLSRVSQSLGITACGLTTSGKAYCWGYGLGGQLGDGVLGGIDYPVAVSGGLTFSTISAGENPVCGLVAGSAYCWGQFGGGARDSVPTVVGGGLSFSSIAAGFQHVCAVAAGPAVYCWGGDGTHGELGVGDTNTRATPTKVAFQP